METTFNEIEINNLVTVHTDHCFFTGVVSRKYEVVNNKGKIWGIELFVDDKRNTIQFTSENVIDIKIWRINTDKEKLSDLADKYKFKYCDANGNLFDSSTLLGSVISSKAYERFNDEEKKTFIESANLQTDDIKNIFDLYLFKHNILVKKGEEKLELVKRQKDFIEKYNEFTSCLPQFKFLYDRLLMDTLGLRDLIEM